MTISTPTANAWRKTFVPLTAIPAIPLVSAGSDVLGYTAPTTTDDGVCLATIADEAFGPFPEQTTDEACSAIERGVFAAQ